MVDADSNTVFVCVLCNCTYTPRIVMRGPRANKYCSDECRAKARHIARQQRPAQHEYACKECGNGFKSKRTDSVYCSRSCNAAANLVIHLSWLPKYTSVYQVICPACGDKRMSRYDKNTPCSIRCGSVMNGRNKVARLAKSTTCKTCGILFSSLYGYRLNSCCSAECTKENDRVNMRRSKEKRKAIIRSGYSDGHKLFDPIDVLKRDGWQCQVCGCDTPSRLRGTHHDDAPEIDHIIPLAKGGTHTWSNVQCLCRICNQMKSDMMPERFIQWNQRGRVSIIPTT